MAKNNVLCMNEEENQQAASGFNRCATEMGDQASAIPSKFSGAVSSGLMGESVSAITKEISALSDSIASMSTIITKHSSQMFEFDRATAQMADEIEIPTDFVANNSMEVNEYTRVLLGKIDGKSVNEGTASIAFNEIDDSTVAAQKLKDITGTTSVEEKYDDRTSIVGESKLGNISGEQAQTQTYDATVSVERTSMGNINSNVQTQQQALDESTILGESRLGNINGNNSTQQQNLDTSTTIAAANLNSVNNNTNSTSFDDNFMGIVQGMNMNMMNSYQEKAKKDDDDNDVNYVNV